MPRIYDSMSDPWDFCNHCFPAETNARERFGGNCFSWDAEHPDYDEEDYKCEDCGRLLTNRDN